MCDTRLKEQHRGCQQRCKCKLFIKLEEHPLINTLKHQVLRQGTKTHLPILYRVILL